MEPCTGRFLLFRGASGSDSSYRNRKKTAKIKDKEGGNKVSGGGTAWRQRHRTVKVAGQF